VVRQMVKNKPLEAVRLHIENIVLEIEIFIENRENMVALARFSPVDLSVDYTDHLDLFSETRPLIRVDVYLEREKIILSGEENIQRLACKHRKVLI
jgi:hypothetical protein